MARSTAWVISVLALGVLLAPPPGTAEPKELKKAPPTASRPGNMSQAAEMASPDDLICTYEKTVGSHLKRRVCMTRAEREQRAREDQDGMTGLQQNQRARDKANRDPESRL